MDIDLALMADAATIDAGGKLNVLGVFDRINASSFPARHGRISLVLRFIAGLHEAGEHEVEITLRNPDGDEVVGLDGNLHFGPGPMHSGGEIRVPHVINLDGLVFEEPGRYTFELRIDGEHHRSVALQVSSGGGQRPARA